MIDSEKYVYNLNIAFESIRANKIRSVLTMLGIIFGVAAVIAMLAIGEGAQQEILEQMKLVGVNNIVVTAKKLESDNSNSQSNKKEVKKFSRGLSLTDVTSITEEVPTVAQISPEVVFETLLITNGKKKQGRLVGVTPNFFELQNLKLQTGGTVFNEAHFKYAKPVCVVGDNIRRYFYNGESPLGKWIKCGQTWFQIIGVLPPIVISESNSQSLGISNYDNEVYAPLQAVLLRYKNRAVVTAASIQHSNGNSDGGSDKGPENSNTASNNQLDKLIIQVKETGLLTTTAEVINRLFLRRHSGVDDFEIKIPELLLKQQQKTKDIFNIVLGAIAGISLIVGGIGIMNIMLASVMERIKEIGVRLSLGATKKDITLQFLTEAVLLSISGGLLGIILGITFSLVIAKAAGILTIISAFSVILSFFVSAFIGIVFGLIPAKRAAELNPIESLRYE